MADHRLTTRRTGRFRPHSFRFAAGTLAAAAGVALAVATPAGATSPAHQAPPLTVAKTISSAFVGPLQFAVNGKQIYVADDFTANLYRVGRPRPLAHNSDPAGSNEEQTADLAGVAVDPSTAAVAFTETNADHSYTRLLELVPGGKPVVLADLSSFEAAHNPERGIHNGIPNPSACVQAAFAQLGIPANYTGIVDSHPYAVVALGGGSWAVADAGGNDIVKVNSAGTVSLLAVLPAVPVKITADLAAANGLPACAVGATYRFESVPTDVELGPNHSLLVSTLASGPNTDQGSLPTGSVYQLSAGGSLTRLATGFNNATNLAYDGSNIYVAELGSGQIAEISRGHTSVVATVPGVVGLEWANGQLYASLAPAAAGADGPGSIVVLRPAA